MLKEYKLLSVLGKGSYGKVYKSICLATGEYVVLKEVSLMGMNEKQQKEALNESKLMSQVHHDSIIQYHTSFIQNKHLYIAMDFASGGDLDSLIRRRKAEKSPFELHEIWDILQQLCEGIEYLHQKRILHRDIKSKNIFLTSSNGIKIGDFGLGRRLGPETYFAKSTVGTPLYFSPELCQEMNYNDKSDIWALGCVLYELATFHVPFRATNQLALARKIVHDQPQAIDKRYGNELHFLITKMLEKDMHARPRITQILNYAPLKQRPSKVEKVKVKMLEKELMQLRLENQKLLTYTKTLEKQVKGITALKQEQQTLGQSIQQVQYYVEKEFQKVHELLLHEPEPELQYAYTAHQLRLCSAMASSRIQSFKVACAWRRGVAASTNPTDWMDLYETLSSCIVTCTKRQTAAAAVSSYIESVNVRFTHTETAETIQVTCIPFEEYQVSPKRQNFIIEISELKLHYREIRGIQFNMYLPEYFDEITVLQYDRTFIELAACSREEREVSDWFATG